MDFRIKNPELLDTVGCCSLRCEHIKLHDEMDNDKYVVEFDFLGKDSIRYYNRVPVEKQVFKNLKIFMEAKEPGDDLFDRLDVSERKIAENKKYNWKNLKKIMCGKRIILNFGARARANLFSRNFEKLKSNLKSSHKFGKMAKLFKRKSKYFREKQL